MDVTPFTGQLRDGSLAVDHFVVNMTTFQEPRAYTGSLFDITWGFEEGPCLYVGNRQAGPIYEVASPNDGVIENIYKDYQVSGAFSEEDYIFGLFNEDRCGGPPTTTTEELVLPTMTIN